MKRDRERARKEKARKAKGAPVQIPIVALDRTTSQARESLKAVLPKKKAFYGCLYDDEPDALLFEQIAHAADIRCGYFYFDILVADQDRARRLLEEAKQVIAKHLRYLAADNIHIGFNTPAVAQSESYPAAAMRS